MGVDCQGKGFHLPPSGDTVQGQFIYTKSRGRGLGLGLGLGMGPSIILG